MRTTELSVNSLFFILLFMALLFSHDTLASFITPGKKLPALTITEGGELYFDNFGQRQYKPWSTISLLGKKRIIQYMPGRLSSRENLHLNDAVYAIDHPHRCRTISVVNYTDAIPGTWIFIEPELSRNKKITPECGIVLDKSGAGLALWGLELGKNATIVVNEQGIVEFFYSGKLSTEQVKMIVNITNPPGVKMPAPKNSKSVFTPAP